MAVFPSAKELDERALKSWLKTSGLELYTDCCEHGPSFASRARDQKQFPFDLCQNNGSCLHQRSCRNIRDQATLKAKLFFRVNGNGNGA